MIVDVLTLGMFQVNCILLADEKTRRGVVVDPGEEPGRIIARIAELDLTIEKILLTHCHVDHAGGAGEVKAATGAPLYFHDLEQDLYGAMPQQAAAFGITAEPGPPRDGALAEGDVIEVDSVKLEVLHTPATPPAAWRCSRGTTRRCWWATPCSPRASAAPTCGAATSRS